jgi:hypothetical protein
MTKSPAIAKMEKAKLRALATGLRPSTTERPKPIIKMEKTQKKKTSMVKDQRGFKPVRQGQDAGVADFISFSSVKRRLGDADA